MAALGLVDDVAQIGEIAFEHVERAEPVQRLDGVISVADPAVAIVPVAARIGRLGDRGGQRGDDRAGLLVLAELQRDRGADHRPAAIRAGWRGRAPSRANGRRSGGASSPACGRHCRRRARPGPRKKWSDSSSRKLRPSSRWMTGASVVRRSGCGSSRKRIWLVPLVRSASRAPQSAAGLSDHLEPRRAGERPDDADEGDRPVHPPRPLEARAEIEDLDRARRRRRSAG